MLTTWSWIQSRWSDGAIASINISSSITSVGACSCYGRCTCVRFRSAAQFQLRLTFSYGARSAVTIGNNSLTFVGIDATHADRSPSVAARPPHQTQQPTNNPPIRSKYSPQNRLFSPSTLGQTFLPADQSQSFFGLTGLIHPLQMTKVL